MRIVNKPWGHEEIWAETKDYVGKVLIINPGHRLSRQYHVQKEETFRVLSGVLLLEIGRPGEEGFHCFYMTEGMIYHCPPNTVHRMICESQEKEPVQVLEVSTPHLDDVVRLEDDYKR